MCRVINQINLTEVKAREGGERAEKERRRKHLTDDGSEGIRGEQTMKRRIIWSGVRGRIGSRIVKVIQRAWWCVDDVVTGFWRKKSSRATSILNN
jgi:hypothetical protein